MSDMTYHIREAAAAPALADWNHPAWKHAETAKIACFYDNDRTTPFRPDVDFRVMHDKKGLYVIFHVADSDVLCENCNQEQVCRDSCVEFFVQPGGRGKYFNFEINAAGKILCYWIENIRGDFLKLPPEDLSLVKIESTLAGKMNQLIPGPLKWTLGLFIPLAFFQRHTAMSAMPKPGDLWRGNFYKCSAVKSNVHYASWTKLPKIDFHQPEFFGSLLFEQ